jgi:hypothetical protein
MHRMQLAELDVLFDLRCGGGTTSGTRLHFAGECVPWVATRTRARRTAHSARSALSFRESQASRAHSGAAVGCFVPLVELSPHGRPMFVCLFVCSAADVCAGPGGFTEYLFYRYVRCDAPDSCQRSQARA